MDIKILNTKSQQNTNKRYKQTLNDNLLSVNAIKNSCDKLLPIYVINLLKYPERKRLMQQQLDELEIPFEWEIAVDGLNLDSQTLEQYKQYEQYTKAHEQWRHPKTNKKVSRQKLSKPSFACSCSHINIYQKIVDAKTPWSVIFEDDIILSDKQHFKTILTNLTNYPPIDCDVIFLGGLYKHYFNSKKNANAILSFFNRIKLPFSYTLGHFIFKPFGSSSYMISLLGAQKMLQRNQPITNGADSAIVAKYKTPSIYIMAINPPLVQINHNLESTLLAARKKAQKIHRQEHNIKQPSKYHIKYKKLLRLFVSVFFIKYFIFIIIFFLKFNVGLFNKNSKHIKETLKIVDRKDKN